MSSTKLRGRLATTLWVATRPPHASSGTCVAAISYEHLFRHVIISAGVMAMQDSEGEGGRGGGWVAVGVARGAQPRAPRSASHPTPNPSDTSIPPTSPSIENMAPRESLHTSQL